MKELDKIIGMFIIILFFSSCQSYNNDPVAPTTNNVPEGAYFNTYTVERPSLPNNFSAAIFWFQAATLSGSHNINDTALIIIDYMKIVEVDLSSNNENIIEFEDYNQNPPGPLNENKGGLYLRYPSWFAGNDYHEPMGDASLIENGELMLFINKHSDRIYHWWNSRYPATPNKKYYIEIRYKIKGSTAIQIGLDWWLNMNASWNGNNVNNQLGFVSDWYGDTENTYKIIKVYNRP